MGNRARLILGEMGSKMDGKVEHRQELDNPCDGCVHKPNDKRKAPEMIARAALRSERTLTERVSMLERVQAEHDKRIAEHDKRIAALERQRVTE